MGASGRKKRPCGASPTLTAATYRTIQARRDDRTPRRRGDGATDEYDEVAAHESNEILDEIQNPKSKIENQDETWAEMPDLILIDGGPGQLGAALEVCAELGIEDLTVAAIAKGADRDAGRERIHMPGREPVTLAPNDPVLYYLQRLRDEAHRFVIGTHRARRSKLIGQSILDEIGGIGSARKRALLHHFGSARNVARAGLPDLEAVPGISKAVAKMVYDHFHGA